MVSDYRVMVYNVFIERGNVAVLTCHIPTTVKDFVEVLGWWRLSESDRDRRQEIHSGGRYLVTTSGTFGHRFLQSFSVLTENSPSVYLIMMILNTKLLVFIVFTNDG